MQPPACHNRIHQHVGLQKKGHLAEYERGGSAFFSKDASLPSEIRAHAKYLEDKFRAEAPFPVFSALASSELETTKDHALYWNYAFRLIPKAYVYNQEYGSCVYASAGGKMVPFLMGVSILGLGNPHSLPEPVQGSLAWYATRGYCAQGSYGGQCAIDFTTLGIPFRMHYVDINLDLRDEDYDEYMPSKEWCRSGPPDELVQKVKDDTFVSITYMDDLSWQAVKAIFDNGGCLHTLSNATASGPANPVARGTKRIGGHAQAMTGYDARPEVLAKYNEKTALILLNQTWGPNWIDFSGWDESLWGQRPEGAVWLRWEDARNFFRDVWAWLPTVNGLEAQPILWETE